jgi:hypothetical protein
VGGGVVSEKGTAMTIDEIEKELRTAIEAQVANGARPERHRWGIELAFHPDGRPFFRFKEETNRCACVVGLWAINHGVYVSGKTAGYAALRSIEIGLGLTVKQANSIALGFDGDSKTESEPGFWDLGYRLAREYVDGIK